MNAPELLQKLTAEGVRLSGNGDKLHVVPATAVTPELRRILTDHKPELLRLVRVRDRLLTVARELGLPDELVLELPASELRATAEQVGWCGDAEVGHRLLVFYLRSLAGVEPTQPGSLAERDQGDRQAHVRALRTGPHSAKETP